MGIEGDGEVMAETDGMGMGGEETGMKMGTGGWRGEVMGEGKKMGLGRGGDGD